MMVRFDAATGRLLIHAGPGVNAQSFTNMLDSLKPNAAHRMRTMESRIDGEQMTLEGKQAVLVPTGVTHEFWNTHDTPAEFIIIMFGDGA